VCEVPRTRIRLALNSHSNSLPRSIPENSIKSSGRITSRSNLVCEHKSKLIFFFPGFVPGSYRTISLLSIRFIVTHLEIRGLHSIKSLRNTIYKCRAPRRFWCLGVAWWRRPALNISLEIQTIKSQLVKNPSSMDDTMLISNSQSDPLGCSETRGSLPSHAGSQSECLVQCGSGVDHLYAIKKIDEVHSKGGKVREFYSYCGGLHLRIAQITHSGSSSHGPHAVRSFPSATQQPSSRRGKL
jgi:Saccharopine dehydrogenase C-terminal domain